MDQHFNTRILVIDDDENVRSSFREILAPRKPAGESDMELERLGASLFGGGAPQAQLMPKRSSATFAFEYDEASNGRQGYDMVKDSVEAGRPYAAIFVDMRMPGWDGLETVQHLRKLDSRAEIIFVTAYTDHSIEEIVTAVGTNVSYHCKPFSIEEIEQIATKAVYEWNKARSLEELIRTISGLRAQHWEMNALLGNVLHQVAYLLGTHSALIAMKRGDRYEKVLSIGNLCDDSLSLEYLQHIPEMLGGDVYQDECFAYFKVDELGVLAIFEKGGHPLNNERIYMVRLFLEQATLAIRNVDLQEALIKKEKLSAVGVATSMIAHDLKNSIGAIEPAIESMEDCLDDREYVTMMLGLIKESARDGISFVMDILDYASNKKVDKSPLVAECLCEEIERKTKPFLLGFEVEFNVSCPKGIIFSADKGKMLRAIMNLIKNAAEALSDKRPAKPLISLSLASAGEHVHINVSDNGAGIPKDVADKIFTPFVSSGKAGGTGLGLAVVKQIVEAHGGEISLDTSPNGTAFRIVLPKAIE